MLISTLAITIKNMLYCYKLMIRINRCKSKCIHVKKIIFEEVKETVICRQCHLI